MSPEKPTQQQLDEWHAEPKNWKFGILYFNPKDKRVFPPKRMKNLGYTINFANPVSVIVLLAFFLIVYYITKAIH
ncbi:MAG: DUF5808 domain-containing protein [Bacteroidia bacterium]